MQICEDCLKKINPNKEFDEFEAENLECDACHKFKQCVIIITNKEGWPNE